MNWWMLAAMALVTALVAQCVRLLTLWQAEQHLNAYAKVRIEDLERRLQVAQERLITAWKEGYAIQPEASEPLEEAPDARFSPNQNEWLDQWEDPQARDRWARFLTARMRTGRSPDGAIADAEIQLVTGQERLLTPQPTSDLRDAG